ncbi:autotransporter domain-containing protein [uncultured Cohaesibacter sp.]|uniref:autotransporter family protein n=1 Tax=uncultured Cohaesibacter sp. TaxID=1002546 RepID=UPI002AA66F96|nr:autotransporter domain-containing protein [uncultured Cohaesibacter sp.]
MFQNFPSITAFSARSTQRHTARGHLIACTALTGALCVAGWGGVALAGSAPTSHEINSTETAPVDVDTRYGGSGTLLLTETGALSITSDTAYAVSTEASNAWTFLINGSINTNGNAGGINSHANDTIIVGETGVIESLNGGSAIYNGIDGISIENSGRITADVFSIMLSNGSLSLTNNAGAKIEGTVQMASGATGSNIDNSGSIAGRDNRSALHLVGDATIYNRAGGTLSSDSTVVEVSSGIGFLENAGSITSTNAVSYDTAGVRFSKSGTVTNAQTGSISADTGVFFGVGSEMLSDKATLTNSGSITGTDKHGALFWDLEEASLTNNATGTIEGASVGAYFLGVENGDITNAGTIRGNYGLYLGHDTNVPTSHVTIANSGTIEGTGTYAISKTNGISYDLTLDTGSNLIGTIQADSNDTLTLKGTGSEDEDLKGFGTITMAGSAWTLSGSVQADALALTSGALTLSGSDLSFGSVTLADTARLIVNGNFSDPVATTVSNGARLGGRGTVGETTVNSGGILSPGNSIGTLNVAGDLTFNAGSVYEVETDPTGTDSDKTIATGNIVINGGTVKHIGFAGNYAPMSTYRILEGGTGLTGSFDDPVTSDYAFLDASLIYDRVNYTVDLKLARNDISFAEKVNTSNQRAAATAAEAAGLGNAVFNAAALLPDNAAVLGAAFDSLSGEVHASMQSSLVNGAGMLRTTVSNRLRSLGTDGVAPLDPVLGYAAQATSASPTDKVFASKDSGYSVNMPEIWGEGFGSWSQKDSSSNAASVSESTGGFLIGADAAVSEAARLGVFAGYGRTDLEVSGRGSSASIDSYHVGTYGVSSFAAGAGLLSLSGGASYSWNDIESDRTVAVGSLTGTPSANYNAGTAQIFGEAGWTIEVGPVGQLEPFAGLAWVGVYTDGFEERGGAAALTSQSQDMSTLFSTLGTRGSTTVALGEQLLELSGALGWRHAFGDVTPVSTVRFDGATPFSVEGASLSRNAALLEAGASLSLSDNARLAFGYKGQIGENAREHSLNIHLSARF